MKTNKEIKSFVKKWMDGHEPDTFIKNESGNYWYTYGASSIDLKVFFEELLKDFIEETGGNESCAGCRFYNSCGLRIDYNNFRCSDFKLKKTNLNLTLKRNTNEIL